MSMPNQGSYLRNFVRFTLATALLAPVWAEDSLPESRGPMSPGPVVSKITDGHLEVGEVVTVEIEGLKEWATKNDPYKLVPYINGFAIEKQYPITVDLRTQAAKFRLKITSANRETWMELIGSPKGLYKAVEFSVGLESGWVFPTKLIVPPEGSNDTEGKARGTLLTVISPWWGVVSLAVTLLILVLTAWLVRNTSILRDPGPSVGGNRRPYNLGRTQAAFWFLLTYIAYVIIWLITDAADTITASLIALMGISGGTALSEVLIDAGKGSASALKDQAAQAEKKALEDGIAEMQAQLAKLVDKPQPTADDAAARDALNRQLLDQRTRLNQHVIQLKELGVGKRSDVSHGFFQDLLSDGQGYSFHRVQILAWMVALGIVFVGKVYYELTMPEFSPTLLGLMGMSAGTYLGFKIPGKQ